MRGESTIGVADRDQVSPARIDQKKREFHQNGQACFGTLPLVPASTSTICIA
jgi:hypothetical protein